MSIRPPFMVSYSITTKCNLKCKHCYSESIDEPAPDELSTEDAFRLMDDLSNWGRISAYGRFIELGNRSSGY